MPKCRVFLLVTVVLTNFFFLEFYRFSGVTESDLKNVTTTLRDVQAVLLSMFSSETILCGHSLDSDLKALKVISKLILKFPALTVKTC